MWDTESRVSHTRIIIINNIPSAESINRHRQACSGLSFPSVGVSHPRFFFASVPDAGNIWKGRRGTAFIKTRSKCSLAGCVCSPLTPPAPFSPVRPGHRPFKKNHVFPSDDTCRGVSIKPLLRVSVVQVSVNHRVCNLWAKKNPQNVHKVALFCPHVGRFCVSTVVVRVTQSPPPSWVSMVSIMSYRSIRQTKWLGLDQLTKMPSFETFKNNVSPSDGPFTPQDNADRRPSRWIFAMNGTSVDRGCLLVSPRQRRPSLLCGTRPRN